MTAVALLCPERALGPGSPRALRVLQCSAPLYAPSTNLTALFGLSSHTPVSVAVSS